MEKGSVTFHGRAHTIFTFVNFEDIPLHWMDRWWWL